MSDIKIKNNKTKTTLVMLSMLTSVLIATILPVMAYDQNSPATFTVNYIIGNDTSFNVLLSGGQQAMTFNANRSQNLVEPVGQSRAGSISWANITNTGNVNLNFSTNITTVYSWVTLYVASNPSMTDKITMSSSPESPAGWLNVAPNNVVQLYSYANFTAQAIPNSASININSHS